MSEVKAKFLAQQNKLYLAFAKALTPEIILLSF